MIKSDSALWRKVADSIYKRNILEFTVFVCGSVVMIYEIIGSRILSPFIGTSTYVWTSLIGVILASLSLGYWYGGRIADRKPDIKYLATVIFIAGGLISVTVMVKEVLLSKIASLALGLELKSVIAAILLFAPASVCLGMVTPFAVRLRMTAIESTGRTVGRLYALSTVGSIVGTFAAGFFLIPFVGSVRTLYLIAAALVLVGSLTAPLAFSTRNIAVVVLLILGIAVTEINIYVLRTQGGVIDVDTEYSRFQVFTTDDPTTGKSMRALAFDPFIVQSAMFVGSDDLVFEYTRYYHLVRHFKPDFSHTLMIGGAGYSYPKEFVRTYPNADIDVVEIDPGMTELAREQFHLHDSHKMHIIHQDGRMFLNEAPPAAYDAVFIDVAGSLFTIPSHLTTVEAVRNVSRILKDDGVVIFNLGSSITGPSSGLLHAELRTYSEVFPHVYLFKVKPEHTDDHLQNLIIVATKSPTENLSNSDPEITRLLSHRYLPELPMDQQTLTDDLAPVEYYNSIAQDAFLSEHR